MGLDETSQNSGISKEEFKNNSKMVDEARYIEAVNKLMDLLHTKKDRPAHLFKLSVNGVARTRESFLLSAIEPAFRARTLKDVLYEVQLAADRLKRLDLFSEIDVLLDVPKDPLATEDAMELVLNVREKSRLWVKTGTEVGNGEGNMNGSINIRNLFGGAETLETNVSFGTRTSSAFQFCLAKPVNASPDAKLDINAFNVVRNNMLFNSHEEVMRGIGARFRGISNFGYHELSYGATWRTIDRLASDASLSVREQAGHSLKSSLQHIFQRDMRDDSVLPSKGYFLRLTQEFAGVGGGDVNFFKNEIESQINFPLGNDWVLSLSARGGLLHSLNAIPSKINDRFFLGGPLSVRGFRTCGIGPRDKKDALGGDAYWAAGASLLAPLYGKLRDWPLRLHLFANGGSLIQVKPGTPVKDSIASLYSTPPSASFGFGLVYRHSVVRIELNFSLPLCITATDQVKKGVQLGLGLSFM
ncbi:uncharacterized protein VTP21DRAFT_3712 [Calcarisporiella thermophila]|uniref:uncharacterized protein n=1 Tax=Calcarisporiella thermophila TaxID=911321 RepID=UPI0037440B38